MFSVKDLSDGNFTENRSVQLLTAMVRCLANPMTDFSKGALPSCWTFATTHLAALTIVMILSSFNI